jgi:hypothetical protein
MSAFPVLSFFGSIRTAFSLPILLSNSLGKPLRPVCLGTWLEADFGLCYNFIDQPFLGRNRLATPLFGLVDITHAAGQISGMSNLAFQAMTMGMTTTLCGGGVGL